MFGWGKLLTSFVSLTSKVLEIRRDNALKKDGARKAEISRRDVMDDIHEEAEDIRNTSNASSKSDVLERL